MPFESDSNTITTDKTHTRTPKQYKVLLLNDDYTPMDFVIFVLMRFFRKTVDEAESIMWKVHKEGVGLAGVYNYEIAETKVAQVIRSARAEGHPLRCDMEEA